MTLIFALQLEDEVLMVSDSAIVEGNNIRSLKESKVYTFTNHGEPVYIGVAGDFACRTAVSDCLEMLAQSQTGASVVGTPVPWFTILAALESLVSSISEGDEGEEATECQFLVATPSQSAFLLTHEGRVNFNDPNFICIGSGAEYAEGALRLLDKFATDWNDPGTPELMANLVCESVEDLCPTVRGPFEILHIPYAELGAKEGKPRNLWE